MEAQGWDDFCTWHDLFDALCNRRGWYDNADPAGELCSLLGKNTVQDFESAKKKLRSWRAGQRLPLKRNFVALGLMLDVEKDPALHRCWTELYRHAHLRPGKDAAALSLPEGEFRRGRVGWSAASIAMLSGCAVVYAAAAVFPTGTPDALPAVSFEGQVNVPLGSAVFVHGALGDCDAPPPDWQDVAAAMPDAQYGKLEDGGLARKVVRKCGRERIVRAVSYTGLRPGTEELRLFGDYLRIDVIEARQ